MNLFQRYNKLNFWNKIAFWGSIASILGLLLFIFTEGEKKGNFSIKDSSPSTVQSMINNSNSTQIQGQAMIDSPKSVQAGRDVKIENFIVNTEKQEKKFEDAQKDRDGKQKKILDTIIGESSAIKSQITDRSFTPSQRNILSTELGKESGRKIIIGWSMGDQEAKNFANRLISIFINAKWKVTMAESLSLGTPLEGLLIIIKKMPAPEEGNIIRRAFKKANYPIIAARNKRQQDNLCLFVGRKK